jgi:hypothetical protein
VLSLNVVTAVTDLILLGPYIIFAMFHEAYAAPVHMDRPLVDGDQRPVGDDAVWLVSGHRPASRP